MIIKNKIVARYYFLIVLTLCVFFIVAFFSYALLMKNLNAKRESMAPLFIARIINILDKNDKVTAIKKFMALQNDNSSPSLELVNQQGEIIYPRKSGKEKISPEILSSLTQAYDHKPLNESGNLNNVIQFPLFKPFNRMRVFLVRLEGEPAYYLKISPPAFAERKVHFFLSLISGFALLFIALFLGVAASIYLIYQSIAKYTKIADQVISDLQNGNLKARFTINRKDEVGQAMERFNKMADEIERLIMCLKKDEKTRINLLQELTHDLKTPITSLKMMLETLETDEDSLNRELKKELITLSRKEIDYFARLIDDLLLLAQVSEPKYQAHQVFTDVCQILNEEVYDCDFRNSRINTSKITKKFSDEVKPVFGDSHLLRRLFRNALDNAISFSRQNISVDLQTIDKNKLKIIIQDDGPGFSEEALKSFGERRLSRKINHNKDHPRVSFGLGSVIMKAICQLHSGTLHVKNVLNDELEVIGASLEIELFCGGLA